MTKWKKVYETLKKRILDGVYPPGSAFPTNKEIGEEFDLHTVTVQTAVSELIREGLVAPAPSRARRRTVRNQVKHVSRRRGGFAHDSQAQGLNYKKEIINIKIIDDPKELPDDVAKLMQTPVLYYHHNQYIEDVLVANSQSYIPNVLDLEMLKNKLTEKTSLYKTMVALGTKPTTVDEALTAKIPDPVDAALLQIPVDSKIPVVKIDRKVYDSDSNLIEYCKLTDRGDVYVFEYRFSF